MPSIPLHSLFDELALLLMAAVVAGVLAIRLRQPLIIAFIVVGVLAGPVGLNVIRSTEQLRVLAEMGLALLLFVVGLKLDPQLIRRMGAVSLATGLGQMAFTGLVGYALALSFGMAAMEAVYVAAALVFSSTILIVKLLSDKRDTDSLYGRISIGFLIVEDIVVVLAMIALSAFNSKSALSPLAQAGLIVAKGGGLFVAVWALNHFVFPKALAMISRSTELLVLFGITWALALAALSEAMGFNKEVGAFVAGLSLASTMYRDLLSTKLASLRDFLLLFFFLELGSHLNLHAVGAQIGAAVVLSLLVLLGKPFIVMVILGRMGYRKRTGFMAGLTVAQISEFSLILVALGQSVGHIGSETLGLVTLVLIITMGVDVHLIIHAQGIYERVSKHLGVFERAHPYREDEIVALSRMPSNSIILIGLGRYGSNILSELVNRGRSVLGVDFDPESVRAWRAKGLKAVFGDAEDADFAHALPLSSTRWVISSIRDNHLNSGIIKTLRHEGYKGHFACAVEESSEETDDILRENTDLVFNPFEDSAVQAADLVFAAEEEIARQTMDKLIDSLSNHYIVCGYGRMGRQIVKDFQRNDVPFVVVEHNPLQVPSLVEENVPHIEGKATEDEVLIRAGIERAYGLISVTATDEENVFIVLTARGLNPGLNIVARSIQQENEAKLIKAGANRVLSPYVYGGRRIAAAILKPRATNFLELLENDEVDMEVEDLKLSDTSKLIGNTVCGIKDMVGVLVLAVRRGGEAYPNPSSDFVVEAGDELVVMGTLTQLESAEELAGTVNDRRNGICRVKETE